MFRSLLLLTLAAATLAGGTAAADVYKYKDEKGNIQYTDKPPSLPAERLNVQSQRTDVVAAQTRSQQPEQRPTSSQQSRNQTAEQQEAAEMTAKDKAERCVKARERYDRYMNSQKLYEKDEKGERRYLSSEELDATRANAKAAMDEMCR